MPPISPPKRGQAADAASVLRLPVETMAASSVFTLLTLMRLPSRKAPAPRSAHANSLYAGAHDTPNTNRAAAHQRDLRGKERAFAHEGLGAIDRVDQPDAFGIHVRLAGLFAIKPIRGKAPGEQVADGLFRAHIGLGDRRLVRLDFDFHIALIETADHFRGGARRVERGLEFVRISGFGMAGEACGSPPDLSIRGESR